MKEVQDKRNSGEMGEARRGKLREVEGGERQVVNEAGALREEQRPKETQAERGREVQTQRYTQEIRYMHR